jgi:hypothetical protein
MASSTRFSSSFEIRWIPAARIGESDKQTRTAALLITSERSEVGTR